MCNGLSNPMLFFYQRCCSREGRLVFFINLPIAVIVVVLTLWRVPETGSETKHEQLDWLGAVLTTLGLGGVVYAFLESAPLFGLLGVLALIAFLFVEARSSSPM